MVHDTLARFKQIRVIEGEIERVNAQIDMKKESLDASWMSTVKPDDMPFVLDGLVEDKRKDILETLGVGGERVETKGRAGLEARLTVELYKLHVLLARLDGFRDEKGRLDACAWRWAFPEFKAIRRGVEEIFEDPLARKVRDRFLDRKYKDKALKGKPDESSDDLRDRLETGAERRDGGGAFRKTRPSPGHSVDRVDRLKPRPGMTNTAPDAVKIKDAEALAYYKQVNTFKGGEPEDKELGDFRLHMIRVNHSIAEVPVAKTGLNFAPWDTELQGWTGELLDMIEHPAHRLFEYGSVEKGMQTAMFRRNMKKREQNQTERPVNAQANDLLIKIEKLMDTGLYTAFSLDKSKEKLSDDMRNIRVLHNVALGHQQAAGNRQLQKKVVAFVAPSGVLSALRSIFTLGI